MATTPMPDQSQQQPDAGASPDQGGASAAPSQGGQQANGLQKLLADWMNVAQQIGTQNQTLAPEMHEITASLRKAFLKTAQAAQAPQQQQQAPPGQ
jgi:hypothetical protein